MDWRCGLTEDIRVLPIIYCSRDKAGVETVLDVVVMRCWNGAVDEVRRDVVVEGRTQSLFQISRTGWPSDDRVSRVLRTQGAGQVLGIQKLKMLGDSKHLRLRVEVFFHRHLNAAGYDAQRRILDSLESFDGRLFGVGNPNRRVEVDFGPDQSFICNQQGLLVFDVLVGFPRHRRRLRRHLTSSAPISVIADAC